MALKIYYSILHTRLYNNTNNKRQLQIYLLILQNNPSKRFNTDSPQNERQMRRGKIYLFSHRFPFNSIPEKYLILISLIRQHDFAFAFNQEITHIEF